MSTVLVVDDEPAIRKVLGKLLSAMGLEVVAAEDGVDALGKLGTRRFDLVITDLKMPRADGFAVLEAVREGTPTTPVVMLTAHGSIQDAVTALRAGAVNFLTKPFSDVELEQVVRDALGRADAGGQATASAREGGDRRADTGARAERPRSRPRGPAERPQISLLGESPKLRAVFQLVEQVAPTDVTVLLLGETGTGKEVVARLIHGLSDRAGAPFVAVNCGAIPEGLVESELFGHARGSFTGATDRRLGKFLQADGGTLFLDEIGELSPAVQVKLLRALQEREVTPVGEDRAQRVDVRVIGATHRDLEAEVEKGRFRADLYYRLNVVPIEIPPLRERREDVPILAGAFLDAANRRFGRNVSLTDAALAALSAYAWPGNVRELEHIIERVVVTALCPEVDVFDLPSKIRGAGAAAGAATSPAAGRVQIPEGGVDLPALLLDLERQYIDEALRMTGGNRNRAAALLGLNRTTLVEKLKRQGS